MRLLKTILLLVLFARGYGQNVTLYSNKDRMVGAWLGVRSGGVIAKKEAIELGGLIGREYVNDVHADPDPIESYRLITTRKDGAVESAQNTGNRYGPGTLLLIAKLESGDKMLFVNIKAKDFWKRIVPVKPLEFIIQ